MKRRTTGIWAVILCIAMVMTGCGASQTVDSNTQSEQKVETQKAEKTTGTEDKKADEPATDAESTKETSDAESSEKASDPESSEKASDTESTKETADTANSEQKQDVSKQENLQSEVADEKEPFVADRSRAFAIMDDIEAGWNLGNTLDSHGAGNSNAAETYWGNPKTTQEMIDAVVAKGFNLIRVPVTWAEHVGPAPEYTINPDWMNRVKEVVDYVYHAGAYVILDTHHEPDYWMTTDPAKADAVEEELVAIWKQVAEFFKDYDEKLIFEGMNEPRLKGSAKEWQGGTAEEQALINDWNQAFIDTVRATGGNNETRLLLICPYGTSANLPAIKALTIPEDNDIAVAIHMYDPYYFTYAQNEPQNDWKEWNGSGKTGIVNTVKQLKMRFIDQGIPVIITEYGAVDKGNREEINKWVVDYLSAMEKQGIKTVWWDNGIYNTAGEKFSIFNRKECSWYAESTADQIMSVVK